jgi:hypothetical protein
MLQTNIILIANNLQRTTTLKESSEGSEGAAEEEGL